MGVRATFSNPKNLDLIGYLVSLKQGKNNTVLDFFAGSGTTGHAVMKLNAEGGGNRKFILCTNNENNICREVTYKRIKRVISPAIFCRFWPLETKKHHAAVICRVVPLLLLRFCFALLLRSAVTLVVVNVLHFLWYGSEIIITRLTLEYVISCMFTLLTAAPTIFSAI